MDNRIRSWLLDIGRSINEIVDFLPEKRDFLVYKNDLKTKRAIERNIEIIGEATKRILEIEPTIRIQNARKIVDTRNRIIHGYDKISDEIIWSIVVRDLPVLQQEVEELLRSI